MSPEERAKNARIIRKMPRGNRFRLMLNQPFFKKNGDLMSASEQADYIDSLRKEDERERR